MSFTTSPWLIGSCVHLATRLGDASKSTGDGLWFSLIVLKSSDCGSEYLDFAVIEWDKWSV
jgi:hypothetical protein